MPELPRKGQAFAFLWAGLGGWLLSSDHKVAAGILILCALIIITMDFIALTVREKEED